MTVVQALPLHGDVFFDVRDDGRNLRVSWHPEHSMVVLSTWRHGSCISSCQIDRVDVPDLVGQLVTGLAAPPSEPWTQPTFVDFTQRRPTRWTTLLDRLTVGRRRPPSESSER